MIRETEIKRLTTSLSALEQLRKQLNSLTEEDLGNWTSRTALNDRFFKETIRLGRALQREYGR